jgi:hypothetical protein
MTSANGSITGDAHSLGGASYMLAMFRTFELLMHSYAKNVVQLLVLLITK